MDIEIERKFLMVGDSWKSQAGEGVPCRQGYLLSDEEKTVRVRMMGEQAFLTIKGATTGISRSEFEYAIPAPEGAALLALCSNGVEKTRYRIIHAGMVWELDVFEAENSGLVMAEIELESEDQPFALPAWAGDEVSGDLRYCNAWLAKQPYCDWDPPQ